MRNTPIQTVAMPPQPLGESIPADKWHPPIEKPRWNPKPHTYLHPPIAPIDPKQLTLAETIRVDKWYKETERPRWETTRALRQYKRDYQAPYPFVAAIDPKQLSLAESIRIDKWFKEAERPRWETTRALRQYLRNYQAPYPFVAAIDPKLLTQHEDVSVDDWFKELEQPLFIPPAKRKLAVIGDVTDFASTQVVTPPPTVTVDMWFVDTENPRWTNATRWAQALSDNTDQAFCESPPFGENIFPDKWHPEMQLPRWDIDRLQNLYPNSQSPQLNAWAETVFLDKWYKELERPRWDVKRRQDLFPFAVYGRILPEVTIDKWFQEAARPRWDIKRWQAMYPATTFFTETQFAEFILPDKWHPETQKPRRNPVVRPWTYPYYAWLQNQFGETSYPDKWHPPIEKPRWNPPYRQWAYPYQAWLQVQFSEAVLPDKWHPEIQRPRARVFRRVYQPSELMVSVSSIPYDWNHPLIVPVIKGESIVALYNPSVLVFPITPPIVTGTIEQHVYIGTAFSAVVSSDNPNVGGGGF